MNMASLTHSHFALFNLSEQFAIDINLLDQAYCAVQSQVHPDQFAASGDAQKRIAMQWATRTNEAYQILRNPLRRAVYLLQLRGVDVGAENNITMEAEFLIQQMTWRKRVEESAATQNIDTLDALFAELHHEKQTRLEKLATMLDSGANQTAKEAVRQLMFIERVEIEINTQIEKLES